MKKNESLGKTSCQSWMKYLLNVSLSERRNWRRLSVATARRMRLSPKSSLRRIPHWNHSSVLL
ncbi:unnamed protein product [Strongylus vulgaris]|uniref:Uncharacterized protein n=1 Tax=Strongylus vulgaris TaxID=40348 RepID=A0A3P7IJY6_STRVU|nr:unnamed protein product [Strongylus vulgaris]